MTSISAEQIAGLDEALRSAFSSTSFRRMLRLRLNKKVDEIAGTGIPFTQTVLAVIETAEEEGWFYDLVSAARAENPGNLALKTFSEQFLAFAPIDGSLERLVAGSKSFVDISSWRHRIWEIEGQVCSIRIAGIFKGTGFLVAPDVVMTNYHVIEHVKHRSTAKGVKGNEVGWIEPSQIELVFDYKRTISGATNPGTPVRVRDNSWLIDFSPYSSIDFIAKEKKPKDPDPDELDYALLRLGESFGGGDRGYIRVSGQPRSLNREEALFIAQHPIDRSNPERQLPLQLALETNADLELNTNGTRLYYKTSTEPGSSGSPCFDYEWSLVALHHSGDPNMFRPATYNEGVPINMIHQLVSQRNLLDIFGK